MDNQQLVSIVMLVGMLILMYLLLIRPQKKQEKAVNAMRSALKVGDDVLTIGGFFGKIVKIKDEVITLQLAGDGVKVEVSKWAISKVAEASDRKADTTPKGKAAQASEAPKKEEKTNAARPKELKKAKKEETPAVEAPKTEAPAEAPAEAKAE